MKNKVQISLTVPQLKILLEAVMELREDCNFRFSNFHHRGFVSAGKWKALKNSEKSLRHIIGCIDPGFIVELDNLILGGEGG